MNMKPEQVMNGTWGSVWFDGEQLAQVISCKAEVGIKTTEILQARNLISGQKLTALEPKGEIKLHHINSFVAKKVSKKLKEGKIPKHTIITYVNDPDAIGSEKVTLYGCIIDKLLLADWEIGKNSEESYSFTFEDWEINEMA